VTDIDYKVVRGKMLSYIKINNFKTYVGEIVVGPLRKLTVVLGRNGSGKNTDYTL
jgi:chromosome segregation ATPase